MKKLWIDLPAFAPDYSGVCSAFYELGGISVIHDASGCTGNYTGYDEPRWYGGEGKVFCSGLREIDAVMGRDDKLIDAVLRAAGDLKPTVLAVMGSPVPMVIGSDMKGIACELEAESGIPAFGFDTNGLFLYNKGISEAMTSLIRRFSENCGNVVENGVNILGMTPLDFGNGRNAEDLADYLSSNGFKVLGRLMMGADLEQIQNLSRAQVNLVAAEAGLEAAKLLQRKYGTPYVAALPLQGDDAVPELLRESIKDRQSRVLRSPARDGDVLIVAEQMLANSLRHAVIGQDPARSVTVGTMFGLKEDLASPGDLDLPNEEDLRGAIESGRFGCIVGDPLFEQLIPPDASARFVPLPHPAVSSKLYWDKVPAYLGEDMKKVLQVILGIST